MKQDYKNLLKASAQKVISAVNLVEASIGGLPEYNINQEYSPKELEPYDALSDRFVRAVETCIKYFKTYEYYLYTLSSDTYRDLLQNMEKRNMISSLETWVDMRDIRNRIVHDYQPHQIKNIYDMMMYEFSKELISIKQKVIQNNSVLEKE